MDKTSIVFAFFVAAIVAGLLVKFHVRIPMPSRETFMQKSVGAPTHGTGMGPYDEVSLAGGFSGWASTEHGAAPISSGPLQGVAEDNKLMFLVGNKTDSSCCPSAFNTDTGCVCLTEQDRHTMASRGGNKV